MQTIDKAMDLPAGLYPEMAARGVAGDRPLALETARGLSDRVQKQPVNVGMSLDAPVTVRGSEATASFFVRQV